MTDGSATILWSIGALVLAVSALTARRLSFGEVLRSLLGWLIIAGIAWALLTNRAQIERVVADVGERFGIGAQQVEGDTVRITMSTDGHFWARASLNGFKKRMLIDSGATITALSDDTARAAGLSVGNAAFPVIITTANGAITAQRGSVETISVGGLETRDLGVVVSPSFGDVNVLGMNFLSRLGSWRVEGRTLILEPKPSKP